MYHQYPYYIFNQNNRNPGYLQPGQVSKHWEQQKKITDMVKAISDENGIHMPSFFGYILWSLCILVPVFLLDTLIFFL